MSVEHWDVARDGPVSEQSMRRKLEARGSQMSCYVYLRGTSFPEHTHGIDKIDALLAGRCRMTMGPTLVVLEASDCLPMPRGAVHRADVVGNESVISLDATKE